MPAAISWTLVPDSGFVSMGKLLDQVVRDQDVSPAAQALRQRQGTGESLCLNAPALSPIRGTVLATRSALMRDAATPARLAPEDGAAEEAAVAMRIAAAAP